MRMNIQSKVGSFLGLVLLISFGLAGWIATHRTIAVVDNLSGEYRTALEEAAYQRALNVFTSLETGAQGSLERGEMLVFAKLINDLGRIQKVQEIGLTNPEGTITFSNIETRRQTRMDANHLKGALAKGKAIYQHQSEGTLLLTRAHYMDSDCIRCHTSAKLGDLAGILFVRYDDRDLLQTLASTTRIAESAAGASIMTGIATGCGGLLLACLGIHFLIGGLVRSPLEKVRDILHRMGGGDFRDRLDLQQDDELGETAGSINRMAGQLNRLISGSRKSVEVLRHVVDDVACATTEVGDATRRERASLETTLATMERIGGSTHRIKEKVDRLEEASSECSSSALEMAASIEEVAISSDQLSSMVQEVSNSITDMATSIQQVSEHADWVKETTFTTATAIEEMEASNREIEQHAKAMAEVALEVQQSTGRGQSSLAETMGGITRVDSVSRETERAMQELAKQAAGIGSVVAVIEEITEQTNLLALNAAIIAAQSGEKGKSFAVVAEEIRELANRTRNSTREISQAIEGIQQVTEKAVVSNRSSHRAIEEWQEQSKDFSRILGEIFDQVRGVSEQIGRIAKSTEEQSRGARMLKGSIEEMTTMVEQSARETAEQSRGAAAIAEASKRMAAVTNQVKNSTREQSQTSRFIAQSMEQIKGQTLEIRESTAVQLSEGSAVIETLVTMRGSSEHTQHTLQILEGAVSGARQEAERLDRAMGVFQISGEEETESEGAGEMAIVPG